MSLAIENAGTFQEIARLEAELGVHWDGEIFNQADERHALAALRWYQRADAEERLLLLDATLFCLASGERAPLPPDPWPEVSDAMLPLVCERLDEMLWTTGNHDWSYVAGDRGDMAACWHALELYRRAQSDDERNMLTDCRRIPE
jgi:TPR repeat protein